MNHNTKTPHDAAVNPQEVAHFSQQAQHWWDTDGPLRTLHQLNPLRLKFIQQHYPGALSSSTCLDVGCGGGILSESLAQHGAAVTAIDASPAVITVAKQHAQDQHLTIDYQATSLDQLCQLQTTPSYDVISCMELLEHVPDPAALIAQCAQQLKTGGMLFISTLHRNLRSFLMNIVAAEYLTNTLPRATHHYGQFIKPSEIAHWAHSAGLEIHSMQGIHYHPIDQQFSLRSGPCGHYIMSLQK